MPTPRGSLGEVVVREMNTADGGTVRALTSAAVGGSPYASSARSSVEAAIARSDPDARAHVAVAREHVIGIILHGAIAGSVGAGRVQLVVVHPDHRRCGVARHLVDTALRHLAADGTRIAFVELPNDPSFAAARSLLRHCGFHVAATVADYFRDGVDLTVLRRDLSAIG